VPSVERLIPPIQVTENRSNRANYAPPVSHRAASLVLLASVQYFVVEAVVAAAWHPPYSWGGDYVSDLGVADRSPLHGLMNASFIAQGLILITAALLLRVAASVPLAVSGVGMVLVGLVPGSVEATYGSLHGLGAGLAIIGGNLASTLTGLRGRGPYAWFSLVCGLVGLVSFVLFVTDVDFGLGKGAVERLAVDPITVWTAMSGLVITLRIWGRSPHVEPAAE
jgi:hypothetical membrane protein